MSVVDETEDKAQKALGARRGGAVRSWLVWPCSNSIRRVERLVRPQFHGHTSHSRPPRNALRGHGQRAATRAQSTGSRTSREPTLHPAGRSHATGGWDCKGSARRTKPGEVKHWSVRAKHEREARNEPRESSGSRACKVTVAVSRTAEFETSACKPTPSTAMTSIHQNRRTTNRHESTRGANNGAYHD